MDPVNAVENVRENTCVYTLLKSWKNVRIP